MSFNFFTTKRVFRVVQYDGIDHFVAFDLSCEKRLLVQFLVGEFHSSAICERFNPLVTHSAPPSDDSVEIILALDSTYKSSSCGPWHIVDEIALVKGCPFGTRLVIVRIITSRIRSILVNDEEYIGSDVHQATIVVAVMDSTGKLVMESILETKAATILQFFAGFAIFS